MFRFCVPGLAADCLATLPLLPGPSADNLYLSHKQRICGFQSGSGGISSANFRTNHKGLGLFFTQNGKRFEEILSIVVVELIHVILYMK